MIRAVPSQLTDPIGLLTSRIGAGQGNGKLVAPPPIKIVPCHQPAAICLTSTSHLWHSVRINARTHMTKKLTISIDDNVYDGLHATIGRGNIGKFLEDLARPFVVPDS